MLLGSCLLVLGHILPATTTTTRTGCFSYLDKTLHPSIQCQDIDDSIDQHTYPSSNSDPFSLLRVPAPRQPAKGTIIFGFPSQQRQRLPRVYSVLQHLTKFHWNFITWDKLNTTCSDGEAIQIISSLLGAENSTASMPYWLLSPSHFPTSLPTNLSNILIDSPRSPHFSQSLPKLLEGIPVLILSNTTIWQPAFQFTAQIPGSVALRIDGNGSTALDMPSSCILNVVGNFWHLGMLPKARQICPVEGEGWAWEEVFKRSSSSSVKV